MILHGVPIDDYHRHAAVSNSKLTAFRKRGARYYRKAFIDRTVDQPDTTALKVGRAFDTWLFDGREAYTQLFAEQPDDMNLTATKKDPRVLPFLEHASGRIILKEKDWGKFPAMHAAIFEHPTAVALLRSGDAQVTVRRVSEDFGLECQVRPDWYNEYGCELTGGRRYMLDLKTTADFSEWWDATDPGNPRSGSAVWKYGYHRQGALAQHLFSREVGPLLHFLLVVEKQEPFRVGVFQLDENYLESGWESVCRDLTNLKRCYDANDWPAGPDQVVKLIPPQWLLDKEAREWDHHDNPKV